MKQTRRVYVVNTPGRLLCWAYCAVTTEKQKCAEFVSYSGVNKKSVEKAKMR